MNFEKGHLYHVFNQGNNRQKIFFSRANYLYFIKKIETHILPIADVVAWCLMPNHFHLLLAPKSTQSSDNLKSSKSTHSSDDSKSTTHSSDDLKSSNELSNSKSSDELPKSIAVMLRSFTRAINIQENRTGSLFKQHTKAQCLTKTDSISPAYLNTTFGTLISMKTPEKDYPKVCLDYIHYNPVKAGLVECAKDWEFSSIHEYNGIEKFSIINMKIAEDFGLTHSSNDY